MSASILFLITIVPYTIAGRATLSGTLRTIVDEAVFRRYAQFSQGVIDIGNIVFFLATTAVFLFLTTMVLQSRRWK